MAMDSPTSKMEMSEIFFSSRKAAQERARVRGSRRSESVLNSMVILLSRDLLLVTWFPEPCFPEKGGALKSNDLPFLSIIRTGGVPAQKASAGGGIVPDPRRADAWGGIGGIGVNL